VAKRSAVDWRAYFELVRLPNVFTAVADVMLGFLITHDSLQPWHVFALLAAASASLYAAGIVLNDLFDLPVDLNQRPERPLPSGRVRVRTAIKLGRGLLGGGVLLGVAAALASAQWRPAIVAPLLAVAVVLYDKVLKRTPLAPVAMGACRFLNVLLGASAAAAPWHAMHWIVALGVGTYIVGVTWFARTEARTSSRPHLLGATIVMLAGLAIVASMPKAAMLEAPAWAGTIVATELAEESVPRPAIASGQRWFLFWGALAVLIGWRAVRAIIDPQPRAVQFAVRHAILSLVVIDAVACFGVRGVFWSCAILLLLLPTMFLGRWIYST
jgi:4-hydroxybenzoate polyprenyltransferase